MAKTYKEFTQRAPEEPVEEGFGFVAPIIKGIGKFGWRGLKGAGSLGWRGAKGAAGLVPAAVGTATALGKPLVGLAGNLVKHALNSAESGHETKISKGQETSAAERIK